MTTTPADLLALRHSVPDSVLLDWLDLAQLVEPPCEIRTPVLCEHWACSQATVSRRLHRLHHAGLLDLSRGWGAYQIHHIGPSVTDRDRHRATG